MFLWGGLVVLLIDLHLGIHFLAVLWSGSLIFYRFACGCSFLLLFYQMGFCFLDWSACGCSFSSPFLLWIFVVLIDLELGTRFLNFQRFCCLFIYLFFFCCVLLFVHLCIRLISWFGHVRLGFWRLAPKGRFLFWNLMTSWLRILMSSRSCWRRNTRILPWLLHLNMPLCKHWF